MFFMSTNEHLNVIRLSRKKGRKSSSRDISKNSILFAMELAFLRNETEWPESGLFESGIYRSCIECAYNV